MTAKQFIEKKQNKHFQDFGVFADTNTKIAEWMQEYALLKCQELLEIVAEKAEIKEYFELSYEWTYTVDRDSILNAVDLNEFIK